MGKRNKDKKEVIEIALKEQNRLRLQIKLAELQIRKSINNMELKKVSYSSP